MQAFPERAFDVGIAEQHAVTLAAGMAAEGLIPFCNIYSTFLQRGFDQVIHDVALQTLSVVFCLDRAGIVGQDGPTHHGVFDLAFLRCIPNLIIFAPMNERELRNMLYTAQLGLSHPLVIRYPRGRGVFPDWQLPFEEIPMGKGQPLREGTGIGIMSLGPCGNTVAGVLDEMPDCRNPGHYNMRFAKPLDEALLHQVFRQYQHIVTIEDGVAAGGFGSSILEFANREKYKQPVYVLGIPDRFLEQGTPEELYRDAGIDAAAIRNQINSILYD